MKPRIFVLPLLFVAGLILIHQFVFYGVWFQIEDIHHETFVVALVCLAVGILIGDRKS